MWNAFYINIAMYAITISWHPCHRVCKKTQETSAKTKFGLLIAQNKATVGSEVEWRKFKFCKRIESEKQQKLQDTIVSSLSQNDLTLHSVYNYSRSIETLYQVTYDMEESLKYRYEKIKWAHE